MILDTSYFRKFRSGRFSLKIKANPKATPQNFLGGGNRAVPPCFILPPALHKGSVASRRTEERQQPPHQLLQLCPRAVHRLVPS